MTLQPHETERLWRDLHGRVAAFVRRRVPSPADADDVVQDVFLRLHVGLAGRHLDHAEAYVVRMARNAVVDWHRRRRPTGDMPEAVAAEPDDDDVREALAGCMRPFVDTLPEPYRQAIVLTELEGVSQAEAARRLGVSASGMRTRVQRGRERLRAVFEACCRFEVDRRGAVMDYEPRCTGSCEPGCA